MATWLIGGVLFVIVAAAAWKMIKDHRSGKGGCGGGCPRCSGCGH